MATVPHKNTCEIRLHGILSGRDLFRGNERGTTTSKTLKRHALPGDVLIAAGKKPFGVFLLTEGQATMATRSGRRLAIDATHSDAIPVLGMLECLADAKMNAGVMAETDCEVTIIGQNDLPDLLTGHPDICLRVAAAAARSYTMAVDAIKNH